MLVGDSSDEPTPSFFPSPSQPLPPTHHRSYIPSLIPPGVDPAKVDSKMFYTYVPNTIKTRKRTTPAQLEILENVFVTDKKPNAPKRKELAKKLKMSPREVQVWFQNRRAKEKKSFSKKDALPTSPASSTSVNAISVATAPITSISDASPSPEAAPDASAESVPPPSGSSPITKIESQTPEPSPRESQNPSWQPSQTPTNDSLDPQQQRHATPTRSLPEANPSAYGLRRSSLPVLSLVPPQEPSPPQLPSSTFPPQMPNQLPSNQSSYHLDPSFPSAVLPPHMLHHRRSTGALAEHPYALPIRRSSATHGDYLPPSGPPPGLSPPQPAPYMRASISEGMDMPGLLPTSRFAQSGAVGVHGSQTHHSARFHPFQPQSRRPNLAHRASVPAIFHAPHTHTHTHHLSAPPPMPPMPPFPPTPTGAVALEEQQQQDAFAWNNPDPFGAGTAAVALAPDAGYTFGMPPSATTTGVAPTSGYEFPERKPSVASSEIDSDYTFTMEGGVYRRSAGSVVSLYGTASDTGTTISTGSSAGPYFSDVTSEGRGVDEDGRRMSCVSTSEMLSRLHVGGGPAAGECSSSPAGADSDGYASEHGTVTYPSPSSDCERLNLSSVGVNQSSIPPNTSGSSELALALHSNESSPYTPPPAFKFTEADTHSSLQPQMAQEYPSYSVANYGGGGGGEYSHSHVNGYPTPVYPNTFDGTEAGSIYPQPVPSPSTADDYTAATRYT